MPWTRATDAYPPDSDPDADRAREHTRARLRGARILDIVTSVYLAAEGGGVTLPPKHVLGPLLATSLMDTLYPGVAVDVPSWPAPSTRTR